MSNESLALIERFFAALNGGDWSAAEALFHEEGVLDIAPGERRIGREALRWWLAERRRGGRETYRDLAAMSSADGSRGAAEFTLRRDDGEISPVNAGMFLAISGGMIERITCFNFPPVSTVQ